MICGGCGKDSLKVKCGFVGNPPDRQYVEWCEQCGGCSIAREVCRDANGDQIAWNDKLNGKYNYMLGEVVNSKRHLQEILRSNNMMQKGDFVNRKDKRMEHMNEHGHAHRGV